MRRARFELISNRWRWSLGFRGAGVRQACVGRLSTHHMVTLWLYTNIEAHRDKQINTSRPSPECRQGASSCLSYGWGRGGPNAKQRRGVTSSLCWACSNCAAHVSALCARRVWRPTNIWAIASTRAPSAIPLVTRPPFRRLCIARVTVHFPHSSVPCSTLAAMAGGSESVRDARRTRSRSGW